MEINTRFGPQSIDPESVLTFPNGLAGFEQLTRYKLFHEEGKPTVYWLQSVDDPGIQFPLATPDLFNVNYEILLSDEELETLELSDDRDVAVLVTLARQEKSSGAAGLRANFQGPVLLNTCRCLGMQKTLHEVEGELTIRAA